MLPLSKPIMLSAEATRERFSQNLKKTLQGEKVVPVHQDKLLPASIRDLPQTYGKMIADMKERMRVNPDKIQEVLSDFPFLVRNAQEFLDADLLLDWANSTAASGKYMAARAAISAMDTRDIWPSAMPMSELHGKIAVLQHAVHFEHGPVVGLMWAYGQAKKKADGALVYQTTGMPPEFVYKFCPLVLSPDGRSVWMLRNATKSILTFLCAFYIVKVSSCIKTTLPGADNPNIPFPPMSMSQKSVPGPSESLMVPPCITTRKKAAAACLMDITPFIPQHHVPGLIQLLSSMQARSLTENLVPPVLSRQVAGEAYAETPPPKRRRENKRKPTYQAMPIATLPSTTPLAQPGIAFTTTANRGAGAADPDLDDFFGYFEKKNPGPA